MAHSITKIWIHGIFSTKDRMPFIIENLETDLHNHIRDSMINQYHTSVKAINGTRDHLHILFLLDHNHSIQEIFHYIKGESSHWINQNNLIRLKFAWQIGYGAFSVGESDVSTVENYIANQKEHHRIRTFSDEFDAVTREYRIELGNQYQCNETIPEKLPLPEPTIDRRGKLR
jgi:putative transposase